MIRLLVVLALLGAAQEKAGDRVPWTASKITGSPEPPPPLRAVNAFPKLHFTAPVHLIPFPGHRRWVLVEEKGMIYSFPNDPAVEKAELMFDARKEIRGLDKLPGVRGVGSTFALVFDPDFAKNRKCYLMYYLATKDRKKPLEDGSRISRFTVTQTDPPRIDPASEEVLITWLAEGHNGCDLHFGNDGYLYFSAGDSESPNPPDRLQTGQDISDLSSSILRIDVHHPADGRLYSIPKDNPFVGVAGARAEIWCYGLRNPWRMSFDRPTGRLWIGDVGWERWESIYCAERGANFGWSVMEGPTPCLPDAKRGPTPIVPPAHALPHPESASITGGFVYHGKKLKGYEGKYIYGDWETRRVWANPVKDNTLGDHEEVARTTLRIVAFAEEADGELLMVDHESGGVHRLEPNDPGLRNADFPRLLSKTGLFTSTADQAPSPGVVPIDIRAPGWADGATGRRWLAVPGLEAVELHDKESEWPKESVWPKDSVLAKTLALEGRKVETQILHYTGGAWNAYAYVWNAEGTDAALAPAEGAEVDLGGGRKWKVGARAACMTCHNPWPGFALTMSTAQLDPAFVASLRKSGYFSKDLPKLKPLVDPFDEKAPLAERARSYLSTNCSHCHRNGGGGSARIDLRCDLKMEDMRVQDVRPTLGTFDLTDPYLVCGGDPSRSVLLFRLSKLGLGRMPHLGSEVVDERGVRLITAWIASLPPGPCEPAAASRRAEDRGASPERLLETPTGALDLLAKLDSMPAEARKASIAKALALAPGLVRDLFERYEPPSQRRERLGTLIKPERILSLAGDVERGRKLFASGAVQCGKCHRLGEGKETMGPDLSKVAVKNSKAQLLESILEPSKLVDPKFAAVVVQTTAGEVLSGILVSKTDAELVLRDAEKETRLPAAKVARTATQKTSLMPEGLLQHLTAQEAADLLAFLATLR